jgi:hypothetical protein
VHPEAPHPDKTYTLTFAVGATKSEVVADRVVLAIPLSILRTVDYSRAGFSAAKTLAIRNEPMGNNAKLNIQFSGRPWADQKQSGDSSSDMVTGATWQASYQAKTPAWLLALNNRNYGGAAAHGLAPAAVLAETNTAIDKLWTGASAKEIKGQFYLDNWPADPWVKGSYAYYGLNGFTTYGGAEAGREGGVRFAGEHPRPTPSGEPWMGPFSPESAARKRSPATSSLSGARTPARARTGCPPRPHRPESPRARATGASVSPTLPAGRRSAPRESGPSGDGAEAAVPPG